MNVGPAGAGKPGDLRTPAGPANLFVKRLVDEGLDVERFVPHKSVRILVALRLLLVLGLGLHVAKSVHLADRGMHRASGEVVAAPRSAGSEVSADRSAATLAVGEGRRAAQGITAMSWPQAGQRISRER